ncbi:C40 family peptidase [Porphyromonas sp.]|uniref:C40 family peptidase n=1 Tax=Porphyromonas sp. TaxID=1924944 RepID=UPI0026DA78E6|nr:C40 family peptidase [Porphyromonas sp.]MDO4770713.1 C40 family peptidase [Porphyromonas sp.]
MQRKVLILILTLLMMGSTSCRVNKPVVMNRVCLPPQPSLEVKKQIKNLSFKLKTPVSAEDNLTLYEFIKDWLRVPYRYGAYTKAGTDCSGFVYHLYKDVYGINVTRTSAQGLRERSHTIPKKDLKEGDLVFFNIRNRTGGAASHVGVYLKNGLFVHAATRTGVTISRLSDSYYSRYYLSAGRIRE